MQNGLEYLTWAHQKLIVSRLKRLWSYGANDFVAKLKIGDAYRRKNPDMPKYIKARFIQIETRIRGKYQRIWLVTSLLDAASRAIACNLPGDVVRNRSAFSPIKTGPIRTPKAGA